LTVAAIAWRQGGAGDNLLTFQIRLTATLREVNFLTGVTPARLFQMSLDCRARWHVTESASRTNSERDKRHQKDHLSNFKRQLRLRWRERLQCRDFLERLDNKDKCIEVQCNHSGDRV
jgi:hypothetical protein